MGSFAEDWRWCIRSPHDNAAWENFLAGQKRVLILIIFRVAARFGVHNLDDVEDAVQEVCLKISSQIRLADVPDPSDTVLESYTKALIANTAHDYFRAKRAKKRDLLAEVALDSDHPARTAGNDDTEKEILLNQLDGLVGKDIRSQSIFRLYFRLGWTAKEIAGISCLGLSAKGVESLVYRLTAELHKKIEAGAVTDPRPAKGPDRDLRDAS
jgi:RNA polymerase sigma factor (sigma-70 family)